MVRTFGHGKVRLQQHSAFINPTNTFFCKSWFALKFHIQGVHKVMNPTFENWTMWLVNVQVQLISNLEEVQRWYKKNVDEYRMEQLNFKVAD
jgi:hypothetical protein